MAIRISFTDQDPMAAMAAAELQRYLALVGGEAAAPTFRLATGATDLHPDGYVIDGTDEQVTITATRPIGVLYGVYGYLEALGYGFLLGGDVIPSSEDLEFKPVNVRAEPVFDMRGSCPFPNFLNSPGTWDLPDFQAFFDQMVKMKNNVVHFAAYRTPLEAYPDEGTWKGGEPHPTSLTYGWGVTGTHWGRRKGLKSEDFGYGTGDWFEGDVFGSTATVTGATRDEQIMGAQQTFADAVAYADRRGLQIVLGIEVYGNPFDPDRHAELTKKIRHLLKTYPSIGHLAVWQPESMAWWCHNEDDVQAWLETPAFAEEYARDAGHFGYLGRPDLIAEAVRMSAWIKKVHALVARERPGVRIHASGWGGDQWMRFTDFFIGLDTTLPGDVIFSALDNIDPSAEPRVSEAYASVSRERERWPIPWFEADNLGRRDGWGPQATTRPMVDLCRDMLAKGGRGFLGNHWRTRDLEETLAFCARFAWDPGITYEGFYEDYARLAFGRRHANELGRILRELESLGPRWTGSLGQREYTSFDWILLDGKPNSRNLSRIANIRTRLSAMLAELEAAGEPHGQDRLRWLILTIDWLTKFDEAAVLLADGGPYDIHRWKYDELRNVDLDEDAWEVVRTAPVGEAMHAFARKISTQGERGVLATINVKAFAALVEVGFEFGLHHGTWAPENVRARAGDETAEIEWKSSVLANGHRVWRRPVGEPGWTCLTPTPVEGTRHEDRPPTPGTYEYAVTAVADPKPESMKSLGATVRVGLPVDPPHLQLISPPTLLWADDHLVLRAIVTGERPITLVRLHARLAGGRELPVADFVHGRAATYRLELPLADLVGQVLHYGIEAHDSAGGRALWPTGYPARPASLNVLP